MNKIRTTIITAAVAGGSVLGLVGVSGFADAASDTAADPVAAAAALIGEDGEEIDDAARAERRAERQAQREENRREIAELLGVDVETLQEAVSEAGNLADVAEANGVETAAVVDLIVEQKTDRIDAAVENGRITAEEAAEKSAELAERVQTRVEEGRPERGDGEGRRGGFGGRGGQQASDGDAADGGDAEG